MMRDSVEASYLSPSLPLSLSHPFTPFQLECTSIKPCVWFRAIQDALIIIDKSPGSTDAPRCLEILSLPYRFQPLTLATERRVCQVYRVMPLFKGIFVSRRIGEYIVHVGPSSRFPFVIISYRNMIENLRSINRPYHTCNVITKIEDTNLIIVTGFE